MPPSEMTGTFGVARGAIGFGDGGDLRHSSAGDDARGTNRAGTDADLDGVGAALHQRAGAVEGANVAGNQINLGKLRLHGLHGVEHAALMRRARYR